MATQTFSPYGFGGPPLQTQLNLSGVAPMPINPGMTGQQAILSRLQPSLDRQRTSLQTQLSNQGLVPGGEAYTNAMTDFGNQENDARQQAILQGLTLDQNANTQGFNQAVQSGDFSNQAMGQQFNQGLAGAQFANQQQQYNQGINAAQHNSTMQGLFGLGSTVGAPLLTKAFGLGGGLSKTAGTIGGAAGTAASALSPAYTAALTAAGFTADTAPASAAALAAAGAPSVGMGGGLVSSLGALASNPITWAVGGAVGIGLLAKHFFGNGGDRQAANQLTGAGGVHDFFDQASQQINQMPDGPEKQAAIDQRDRTAEQQLVNFSKIDKNHYYQAKQTLEQLSQFSTVKPLLG
jgi:hypothetical protein